jgi:hypothetical protein
MGADPAADERRFRRLNLEKKLFSEFRNHCSNQSERALPRNSTSI